jgi:hypothetical protein
MDKALPAELAAWRADPSLASLPAQTCSQQMCHAVTSLPNTFQAIVSKQIIKQRECARGAAGRGCVAQNSRNDRTLRPHVRVISGRCPNAY